MLICMEMKANVIRGFHSLDICIYRRASLSLGCRRPVDVFLQPTAAERRGEDREHHVMEDVLRLVADGRDTLTQMFRE